MPSASLESALLTALKHVNSKYLQDEYAINKQRYFETLALVTKKIPENSRILEVGCSPGLFSIALAQFRYELKSIDLNPENCLEFEYKNSQFKKCDLETDAIPFSENSFDCVLLTEVIEHIHPFRIGYVLQETHRCLKPGGVLLLSTPNLFALENRIFMLIGGINALGGGITPPHHTREYGMREMVIALQKANYKIESKTFSTARDYVTVRETWKNLGRKLVYPAKKIIPSFRSTIFIIATKQKN